MNRLILTLIFLFVLLPLSLGKAHCSGMVQLAPQPISAGPTTQTPKADQIRKECVAYVTRTCKLTADEAKALDTELARYDRKKMILWKERAELLDLLENGDLSDYKYGKTLEKVLNLDVELKKCRLRLYLSLKPYFQNKKLGEIYIAIKDFKQDISTRQGEL